MVLVIMDLMWDTSVEAVEFPIRTKRQAGARGLAARCYECDLGYTAAGVGWISESKKVYESWGATGRLGLETD